VLELGDAGVVSLEVVDTDLLDVAPVATVLSGTTEPNARFARAPYRPGRSEFGRVGRSCAGFGALSEKGARLERSSRG